MYVGGFMELVSLCPVCGARFREGGCPNGHGGPYLSRVLVGDCEVRDFERFSLLTGTVQQLILTSIEAGEGPGFLYPLFLRLRDFGVLVCS